MSSTMNYKINNFYTGYAPWAYYGDNGLQNIWGNPANNSAKKKSEDKAIDIEINYQQQQKNYKSVEPNIMNTYNLSGWWGQHYFGTTVTTLEQDQFNYGPTGNQKTKFQETENKYMLSYAYPLIDNYLAGGLSLNYNEKSVGFETQEQFNRLGLDLGLSVNNLIPNFGLGFGLKNYARPQEINGIKFLPDSSWGLGASYRFNSDIVIAGDYNKYLYSDLFNTSLRGKYEFTSSYLNITPEIIYMLNNNIADETQQRIGANLCLGKDFKISRTVRQSYEVPVLAGFNYTYQVSNDTILPLQFKKITITKEFSKEKRSWDLTVYAPPLNKKINDNTEAYCVFELKNEAGNKYYFTREADKNSPKESITLTANVPAGKYFVTSYYADQNHKVLSPVYKDPDPKYVGICYTVSESTADSDLTIPRQYANDLYDLQDEYLRVYTEYSECFDYIQTDAERKRKEEAYGSINGIYAYLENINSFKNMITNKEKEIISLRGNMIDYSEQLSSKSLEGNEYHRINNLYRGAEVKISDLEKEISVIQEKIAINNNEIKNLQSTVNELNTIPELIGLSSEEQLKTMLEYRPLYLERYQELNDQRIKGLKLDRMEALNNNFHMFYKKSYASLNKMIRADISEKTKNQQINQTGIDTLVNGMLQKNKITDLAKADVSNLPFGESITFYYPWHNIHKSTWEDKAGSLQVSYDKVEKLSKEEHAAFVKKQAKLRGTSRLKPDTEIKYEIKKYETRWKNVYSPYYIGFDIGGGYGYSFGTDQTNEYSFWGSVSVRGF